jgi:hypothetical protein
VLLAAEPGLLLLLQPRQTTNNAAGKQCMRCVIINASDSS